MKLVCSDYENPITATKDMIFDHVYINFDEEDDGMEIPTEFHFYDTIISIYAYGNGDYLLDDKQRLNVAYGDTV